MRSKKIVAASGVVLFVVLIAILIVTLILTQQKTTTKSQAGPGATHTICPSGTPGQNGCNYIGGDGISQAINYALSGDTMLIKAGTYTPNAGFTIIDKNLEFVGEGSSLTFINGVNVNSGLAAFTVSGNSQVVISKLAINSYYQSSLSGIYISGSAMVTAKNITISDINNVGILLDTLSRLQLTNSVVHYCGRGAILFDNGDPNYESQIVNNVFHDNGYYSSTSYQVSLFRGPKVLMENNIIVNSTSGGVYLANQGTSTNFYGQLNFRYNDVWNNSQGNYLGSLPSQTGQNGNISANPLFVSQYYDLTLKSTSPAKDTGNPDAGSNDLDGSRNDMGVFGGPGAIIPSNSDCLTGEVEPNDTFTQAANQNRLCPGEIKGTLSQTGTNPDYNDGFRFVLTSPAEVILDLTNIPSGSDYDLFLYSSDPYLAAWSYENGTTPEKITRVLQAGSYFVDVNLAAGGSTTEEYALKLTLNPPPPPSTITLRVKFAGLTSDVGPITATRVILRTPDWSSFYQKFDGDESLIFTYVNGAYQTTIPNLYLPSGTNTYDILVKGPAHLQSKVSGRLGVTISPNLIGQNILIDRSNTATTDVVRAGDVVRIVYNQYGQSSTVDGQDGVLTLEDVTAVSSIYSSLQAPVPAGLERRDINQDGYITIEDLSLIAYNYSSLVVYEDW